MYLFLIVIRRLSSLLGVVGRRVKTCSCRICPSRDWIDCQIPEIVKEGIAKLSDDARDSDEVDAEALVQAYVNIVAGACIVLGLKYAGTKNSDAQELLYSYARYFLNEIKHISLTSGSIFPKGISAHVDRGTLELCLHLIVLSLSVVGLALKKLFEDGVVKREDLFITSKLWCSYHAPEDVPEAMDLTLNELQLDYVDLYLIHWPYRIKKGSCFSPENFIQPDIPATWSAMEKLYDAGKARAIGVSNFSTKKLEDLVAVARTPPAVNQVECHPGWQQAKLRGFCQSTGVHLSAYSPLGSPGTTFIKGSNVLTDSIVNMIADKLGKTPAQVALRWGLQMGHSVLPKSTSEARIKENLDIFDWSIPEDLIAKFSEIEQARLLRGNFVVHPQSIYKSLEDFWDGEI